ncbi:MAG: hypothetical protein Q8R35_01850 [bacterium]|nr:hypothetical protein [bacterium]
MTEYDTPEVKGKQEKRPHENHAAFGERPVELLESVLPNFFEDFFGLRLDSGILDGVPDIRFQVLRPLTDLLAVGVARSIGTEEFSDYLFPPSNPLLFHVAPLLIRGY